MRDQAGAARDERAEPAAGGALRDGSRMRASAARLGAQSLERVLAEVAPQHERERQHEHWRGIGEQFRVAGQCEQTCEYRRDCRRKRKQALVPDRHGASGYREARDALAYFRRAMSRNQRILLVVAAVAVAVIAFVIASPGGDDEDDGNQAAQTTTQTEVETQTDVETETEVETETTPPEPQVSVTRIQIQGGEVVGGPQSIEVEQGERVRIVVASDAPDDIHLHGYDIEHEAAPGAPARFNFTADAEGVFEMESHTAEDAGLEPLIARLVVNPS